MVPPWPNHARLAVCVVVRDGAVSTEYSATAMERLRGRLIDSAAQLQVPLTWVGGRAGLGGEAVQQLAAPSEGAGSDLAIVEAFEDRPRYLLRLDATSTPYWIEQHNAQTLVLPLDPDCTDSCMLQQPWWTPDEWLQYAMDAFDCLHLEEQSSLYGLCISPAGVGRSGAIQALRQLLAYIGQREQVWLASAGQIAANCARVKGG